MLKRLQSTGVAFADQLELLLRRDQYSEANSQITQSVAAIIRDVRERGDVALHDYTRRYDGFSLADVGGMEISQKELSKSLDGIDPEQRQALEYAAGRIRDYHQRNIAASWDYTDEHGTLLGQKVTPLGRAGLYVPGGKAAYPSSVLMNAIPAKVAGVGELVMVTPTPNGEANSLVLAAAKIAGIDRVFRVGGAQAVAALAYGTETVHKVDKITGPGNAYVAAAKQQVFGYVGIDMVAGPSEVLIIADDCVDPEWVAMDLFAQAEHDERAQSLLLSSDAEYVELVISAVERLLPTMARRSIIAESLRSNGAAIIAEDDSEIIRIADQIAAEHLEIFTHNASDLAANITNAGAIFVGRYSAESLGDYCAGPNHVLPTSGAARFSSPLGVYDFQKRTSILDITQSGAQELASNAAILADGESLSAHAMSARFRLDKKRNMHS